MDPWHVFQHNFTHADEADAVDEAGEAEQKSMDSQDEADQVQQQASEEQVEEQTEQHNFQAGMSVWQDLLQDDKIAVELESTDDSGSYDDNYFTDISNNQVKHGDQSLVSMNVGQLESQEPDSEDNLEEDSEEALEEASAENSTVWSTESPESPESLESSESSDEGTFSSQNTTRSSFSEFKSHNTQSAKLLEAERALELALNLYKVDTQLHQQVRLVEAAIIAKRAAKRWGMTPGISSLLNLFKDDIQQARQSLSVAWDDDLVAEAKAYNSQFDLLMKSTNVCAADFEQVDNAKHTQQPQTPTNRVAKPNVFTEVKDIVEAELASRANCQMLQNQQQESHQQGSNQCLELQVAKLSSIVESHARCLSELQTQVRELTAQVQHSNYLSNYLSNQQSNQQSSQGFDDGDFAMPGFTNWL